MPVCYTIIIFNECDNTHRCFAPADLIISSWAQRYSDALSDSLFGFFLLISPVFYPPSLQAHQCAHPQAWPVSGSRSKFKPEQGQLLLQTLCCYFPCWGGFFCHRPWVPRRGLWLWWGTESQRARWRGETGWHRNVHRTSRPGSQWSDWQRGAVGASVWDYSVSGFTSEARLRWRLRDGNQRRSGKAGHHEWRGAEEEAEGEAEEATGHRGQPSTHQVPLLLHPQKSLPQGLHQHRGVEVSFMSSLCEVFWVSEATLALLTLVSSCLPQSGGQWRISQVEGCGKQIRSVLRPSSEC